MRGSHTVGCCLNNIAGSFLTFPWKKKSSIARLTKIPDPLFLSIRERQNYFPFRAVWIRFWNRRQGIMFQVFQSSCRCSSIEHKSQMKISVRRCYCVYCLQLFFQILFTINSLYNFMAISKYSATISNYCFKKLLNFLWLLGIEKYKTSCMYHKKKISKKKKRIQRIKIFCNV